MMPEIFYPTAFIFLLNATPGTGSAWFYFYSSKPYVKSPLFRTSHIILMHACMCTMHVCIHVSIYSATHHCNKTLVLLMQHTATHYNTLQHTATHCNTLQHTATHCNTLLHTERHCFILQHTIMHCNTLQHTTVTTRATRLLYQAATHYNTLQHIATHCNTPRRTTTHCNTLQR